MFTAKENHKNFEYYAIIGLFFAHIATAQHWWAGESFTVFLENSIYTSCYPFFKSCSEYNTPNINLLKGIFIFYFAAALFGFIFSFSKRYRKYVYFYFIFLFIFKLLIFIPRYNFMGAYHTMHFTMCLVLLLKSLPLYRVFLGTQYFLAGLIKLNLEWTSGASASRFSNHILPDPFFLSSLSYVILLELVLVWGICAKNKLVRQITLLQLILFHLYSYLMVGTFYPLVMAGILLPLVYEDFFARKQKLSFKKIWWPQFIFLFFILFWNFSSKFYSIESHFDGNIRYLTLYMYDARVQCNMNLYKIEENDNVSSLQIPRLSGSTRTKCDPLLYKALLKKVCLENPQDKLQFYLESRITTSNNFKTVRVYTDLCNEI